MVALLLQQLRQLADRRARVRVVGPERILVNLERAPCRRLVDLQCAPPLEVRVVYILLLSLIAGSGQRGGRAV